MSKKIHVRPGKSQSKISFGVCIVFCLLGVFVVIPTFGLFGIFWTAVAGWMAYSSYKTGFTDDPMDSHIIEIEDDGRTYGARDYGVPEELLSKEEDVENRLVKLQELYEKSLITYEEYEEKKRDILEDL